MPGADVLIAVDVGTSGARASAFDVAGAPLDEVRRSYPTYLPAEGWAEQDARRWQSARDDIIIRPELSRRLFDALGPDVGTWAVVPGGHAAFWENPGPWNSAVIDFVRRNGTP
jgi:pimeloyl-ACP methyl ester carboxylesterase